MKARLDRLEVLRAFACLGVFTFHAYITLLGACSVSIFIILSGFLLTYNGLDRADKKLIEMAYVFRMSFARQLRAIYIPAAFPYLLTAVRLSLGMCWKAGIAAEVIGQPKNSIGSALYQAKILLSTHELFAWTLAIILLSVLIEKAALLLIKQLSRRLNYGN